MRKIFLIIIILISSSGAFANYCSDENWDVGKELSGDSKNQAVKVVDEYNNLIDITNEADHIASQISVSELSDLLYQGQASIDGIIAIYKSNAQTMIDKLNSLKKRTITARKSINKAKRLWARLSDYCHSEDEYANARIATSNSNGNAQIEKQLDQLIANVDRIINLYQKDLDHLEKAAKLSEKYNCNCSN